MGIQRRVPPAREEGRELARGRGAHTRRRRGRGSMVFPPPPTPEEAKNNPVALLELREHYSREKLVKIEEQKLVREELKQCYRREGVNHISKCKDLANEYIKLVKENQAALSLN